MAWWLWILIGVGLLIVETLTPGAFVAAFFAIGALGVGVLVGLGWVNPPWAQWLAFSVITVLGVALLRRPLQRLLDKGVTGTRVDDLVGEAAVVLEDVPPGGTGKVELRGSSWTARNVDGLVLEKGRRCRVERRDGLTLWVRLE